MCLYFQVGPDGSEDSSLEEILSIMDEIQRELMNEGQNSISTCTILFFFNKQTCLFFVPPVSCQLASLMGFLLP